MSGKDKLWQREDLGKRYLEGVRSAMPLADIQIEVMLNIIQKARADLSNFLDLGCGDGVLGWAVLSKYPKAKGVFLDFSDTMIDAARKKAPKDNNDLNFITADYGKSAWINFVTKYGKFDVIVSGLSIHHQKDSRKKTLYKEIFDLLNPGGVFLNLEHVASATPWLQHVFDEYFIDALYKYHYSIDPNKKREEIAIAHYNNPLKSINILAPVDKQCSWLRQIGFKEVDCYLKIFELALFGGIKPK